MSKTGRLHLLRILGTKAVKRGKRLQTQKRFLGEVNCETNLPQHTAGQTGYHKE